MTFRALSGDSPDTLTTVARFLALLELFREGAVAFDQVTPLGELTVRWTGPTTARSRSPTSSTDARGPGTEPADQEDKPRGDEERPRAEPRRRGPLEVPLADLRPALEAVLMVADQPLDHLTLASALGYPPGQVVEALETLAAEYDEQGRGFELRNVAGGWRYYTREEYAAGRGAVRARRPAGAADPGRPGDPGGGRLQAAGEPRARLGDPRRQRRRRDAHPGDPRTGRGDRSRPRDRRDASTGPRATSSNASGSPRSTSCPSWPRSCRTWVSATTPTAGGARPP